MVRIFLVVVSVLLMFLIPGLFVYLVQQNKITDMNIIVNSLMPLISLIVLCIGLYKIISVLQEIKDK